MERMLRIDRALQKAVPAFLALNVFLSIVSLAIVGGAQLNFGRQAQPVDAGQAQRFSEIADARPITLEQVTEATTGKAIFRSNTVRQVKTVDELGYYRLQGLSVGDGEARAYVRDTKLKKTLVKKVGDFLGPYEITGITSQGLVIKRGAEEVILPKG